MATEVKKLNWIRRLYNWTISWADRPGGSYALFILAFIESSFFLIPPDVLLMALCFGKQEKWWKYAIICSVGSVLGGVFGWWVGLTMWHHLSSFFFAHIFSEQIFNQVQVMYQNNAFLAIFTAAFTPIPYKAFTIASGVFGVPLMTLVSASIVGRSLRFFIVAGLIGLLGKRIQPFIDKNLEWCFIAGTVLLIGGFALMKYL